MSAKGQKRTSVRLLNQLVPPAQATRRHSQVECFFEVISTSYLLPFFVPSGRGAASRLPV
jgi:hypothetical protein